MRNVDFHHLRGKWGWLRCDHFQTGLDPELHTVRLQPRRISKTAGAASLQDVADWLEVRGDGVFVECSPNRCDDAMALVTGDDGQLQRVVGREQRPWPLPATVGRYEARGVALDAARRIWVLDGYHGRLLLIGRNGRRLMDTLALPGGADRPDYDGLAAGSDGVVVIARGSLQVWFHPYGGEWRRIDAEEAGIDPEAVIADVDAAADGPAYVLWRFDDRPGGSVLSVDGESVTALALGGGDDSDVEATVESPMHLVCVGPAEVLISDLSERARRRMRFAEFQRSDSSLRLTGHHQIKGFDGRALILGPEGDEVFATTASGLLLLHAISPDYVTRGVVETAALDSGVAGCQWHRVFVDACVPEGCSLQLQVRCADDPYRPGETPPLRAPPGFEDDTEQLVESLRQTSPGADVPPTGRLGSRLAIGRADDSVDDDGWIAVGELHRRPARADAPWRPGLTTAPDGANGVDRRDFDDETFDTFEGLLKTEPGRYLWLRVVLEGSGRITPVVTAIRATFQRPSLLDLLPSFWRADDAQAKKLDELLSLFEGEFTELDERIGVLTKLFDPRLVPDAMLDWLARFLGVVFDHRLAVSTRRRLLMETPQLYRRRGTVWAVRRVVEIISGTSVRILEGFRMRRRVMPVVGRSVDGMDPVLGAGLELGAATRPETGDAHGEDDDPVPRFFGRLAHHFQVVLVGPVDEDLLGVIDDAVEATKPAHTVHDICSPTEGFITGVNTVVGVGTRPTRSSNSTPSVVGDATLGTRHTVATADSPEQSGIVASATPAWIQHERSKP